MYNSSCNIVTEHEQRKTLFLFSSMHKPHNLYCSNKPSLHPKICTDMQNKGYSMTGDQCRAKINNTLTTYKRTKDKSQKPGMERITWEYYVVRRKCI